MNHIGTMGALARCLSRGRSAVRTVDTDAECLGLFVATRCEESFAELVRRFGPTVLGVCRRTLGNTPEADEAFQATFLILMKKADTIRPAHRVGAWLYGVVVLASKKARTARNRRQLRHVTTDQLDAVAARDAISQPDLYPLIDEELARLPEKFRLPILLCGLRELTTSEAATELGWPIGTLASRLSRGRGLLHRRLMQRGVLGAAALALSSALAPALSPALLHTTLTTVLGEVFAPVPVLALVSHVVFQMKVTFFRWVAGSVLGTAALVVWGGNSYTPSTMAAPLPVSLAAKPKPVMDRMKLNGIEFLLGSEEIRKEIGLAEADYKVIKADALAKREEANKKEQMRPPAPARVGKADGVGPAGGGVKMSIFQENGEYQRAARAIQDDIVKDVCEKLKPDGLHRLKQIYLQDQGPRVMLDRLVIRELQLSAEQEDKLDETLKAKHMGFIAKEVTAKMAEEVDEEWKSIRKMLSTEQVKKLDDLMGKTLPTVVFLQANPRHENHYGQSVQVMRVGVAAPALPALPVAPPIPEKK
jgi:RNA polymerase sigma factor (sigma-70 family)